MKTETTHPVRSRQWRVEFPDDAADDPEEESRHIRLLENNLHGCIQIILSYPVKGYNSLNSLTLNKPAYRRLNRILINTVMNVILIKEKSENIKILQAWIFSKN